MTQKKNNPLILVIFFLIFVCGILGTIAFVMQVMKPKSENFGPLSKALAFDDTNKDGQFSYGEMSHGDNMSFDIYNWRPGVKLETTYTIETTPGTYHHGTFDIYSVNIGQMGSSNEIFLYVLK